MKSLSQLIDEGVREGMRCAFENNAYENCDGSDDPDDRCPSTGGCVCSYMYWKSLPWWKRLFSTPVLRPSLEDCQKLVIDRMVEDAFDNLSTRRITDAGRSALRSRVRELEGAINTHFEALDRHDKSNDGFGKSRETYAEVMGTLADLRRAATKTMEGEQ